MSSIDIYKEGAVYNIEKMAEEAKRLSSLNNKLYEKNNLLVKKLFTMRSDMQKLRLEVAEYKKKCEDKDFYIQYLEERIELQNVNEGD